MKKGLSPRLALVAIFSMFILPLALAWLMYSGTIDYDPVETRNLGSLVEPPVPLALETLEWPEEGSARNLETHWVILYALPEICDNACLEQATALRQVHRASGRNQSRLRMVLLGDTSAEAGRQLGEISGEFHRASDRNGEAATVLREVAARFYSPHGGSVYLIDPLGNIMLFYAAGFDPNDLKKDLKRLLTWSKLDEQ